MAHKDEILAVVRRQEREESTEHITHRIMGVQQSPSEMLIKTTDIHLPRRIGEAIRRAFKGDLTMDYQEDGCLLRVGWCREA